MKEDRGLGEVDGDRLGVRDNQPSVEELTIRAKRLLEDKERSRPRRPLIVEFSGSPKAGKSTVINALATFLRRNGFSVRVVREFAAECPIRDKTNWLFNLWTSTSVIRHVAEHLGGKGSEVDVLLFDRGLFDSLCWLTWLEQTQKIDCDTHDRIAGFLLIERLRAAIDLVLTFRVRPSTSIERENAQLLTHKGGSIMNEVVLQQFLNAIEVAKRRYQDAFPRVLEIASTDSSVQDSALVVTQQIFGALSESMQEKVGYFDRDRLEDIFQGRELVMLDEIVDGSLSLEFADRVTVEDSPGFVQPVAVAVLTDETQSRVALWVKNRRSLGKGVSPEEDRQLVYLGGHVRPEDSFERKSTDIGGVLDRTLNRELDEEIGQVPRRTRANPFCIWDRSGPEKSKRHMAVVYVHEVDFDVFEPVVDRWEFDRDSYRVTQISSVESDLLERWSAVIMDKVFPRGGQAALFSLP